MPKEHKAIIVHYEPGSDQATEEPNVLLNNIWTFVSTS